MISAPSAIHAECAGCPLSTNCFANTCSTVSQGIRLASLTHSFSGSSSQNGKQVLECQPSLLLVHPYSLLRKLFKGFFTFPCTCIIPYRPFACWFSYVLVGAEQTLCWHLMTMCNSFFVPILAAVSENELQ